jgi:hypothetical protein
MSLALEPLRQTKTILLCAGRPRRRDGIVL